MADIGHPTPALHFPDWKIGFAQLGVIVQRVMQGKLNNAGTVTLTDSSATTAVTDKRVGTNSKITFTATTANAAAEVGAGGFYVSAKGDGTFTLTHANNAQTDRDFDYTIGG